MIVSSSSLTLSTASLTFTLCCLSASTFLWIVEANVSNSAFASDLSLSNSSRVFATRVSLVVVVVNPRPAASLATASSFSDLTTTELALADSSANTGFTDCTNATASVAPLIARNDFLLIGKSHLSFYKLCSHYTTVVFFVKILKIFNKICFKSVHAESFILK